MKVTELQKEAHAIAKEAGWWDEPPAFGDLIALVHSDLSAVLEAHRAFHGRIPPNHSWAILGERLADVVIRVADMAEWYGYDLSIAEEYKPFDYFKPDALTFGMRIAMLHGIVAVAFGNEGSEILVEVSLATLVVAVQRMAAHYGIDLDAAIAAKMEYNMTRPYRHGSKAL